MKFCRSMLQFLPIIGPYFEYFNQLFIQLTVEILKWTAQLLVLLYESLPQSLKNNLMDLVSYSDLFFGIAVFYVLVNRPHSSWNNQSFIISSVAIVLLFTGQLYLTNVIVSKQFGAHFAQYNSSSDFVQALPLDYQIGFTYDQCISFFESSGPVGRFAYALFSLCDFVTAVLWNIGLRQLMTVFYKVSEEDKGNFVFHLLPAVLTSLDLYENTVFCFMLFLWSSNMSSGQSHINIPMSLASRASIATEYKYKLAYVLAGLVLNGMVRYAMAGKKDVPNPGPNPPKSSKSKSPIASKSKKKQ
jgi:hypothetical protein